MDTLTITSTGWGPNYLPQNVADWEGFFERQDLDVIRRPQSPWEGVLSDLANGDADIALGGMWVPAMYHGIARDLVVVGQLNGEYAQALLTRPGDGDVGWAAWRGRTFVIPGAGGTAGYTFLTGLMREAGEDPAGYRYVRDLSSSMLTECFLGGLGDVMLADLATAYRLQLAGQARIATLLAPIGGALPNSVYYMRRERLAELSDQLGRFLMGVQGAMNWLAVNGQAESLAAAGSEVFAHLDPAVLRAAIGHVLTTKTWESVHIEPAAFDRWIKFQLDVPIIQKSISYGELVDDAASTHAWTSAGG